LTGAFAAALTGALDAVVLVFLAGVFTGFFIAVAMESTNNKVAGVTRELL
jgi:hypothetical protein